MENRPVPLQFPAVVPEPGARVSHYRLIQRLGTGGMGQVYLAHDDKLDRSVAIKFLLGDSDERARRRLMTEARAVAALDHPNICSIHEIDADLVLGDFIVMQYVEGETLSDRLQRGRMLPGEALGTCGRIADALRAAHARGVIHRDLKPQNVILTSSGDPKLLDFGLAKNISSTAKAAVAPTETQLTKPHAVLGTAGYMSPEQVRGHTADQRSDLFSLGCLLYECLTGKRAFTGGTSADIHAEVLHRDPPPPSTLVPELDASHDALVARLLEKDPQQRFQSAEEALGAIRVLDPSRRSSTGVSNTAPVIPTPPRRSRARTVAIAVASIVGVVALVLWLGPWLWRLPEAPPEAARWYATGVEAIREGRFVAARTSFEAAISKFPEYSLAYLRLADARTELDDTLGANNALARARDVMPRGVRLTREQDQRFAAVSASVLRNHSKAIEAYGELARSHATEAAAWLDLGRAQEAAGRRPDALKSYRRALALDSQYAAAHLRLGGLYMQQNLWEAAVKEFDEAIRLYEIAGQSEGQIEALIRRAETLTTNGSYREARVSIDRAMPMISAQQTFHRVRATFDLARLMSTEGRYAEAEKLSRATVDEATAATLYSTASQGLTDFCHTLTVTRRFDEAESVIQRAIDLAIKHEAKRAEMRAKMQRASLLYERNENQAAIDQAEEPLKFYKDNGFPRPEADGKNIVARGYERLERYGAAEQITRQLISSAEIMGDDSLRAVSMESLASQLVSQGRLPEALAYQETLEAIYRKQKDDTALPYALNNRAEILVRLGRGQEGEPLLAELVSKAAAGIESYRARTRRTAVVRAMRATFERNWVDVEREAAMAMALSSPAAKPDTNWRWGAVLLEHAKAQQRRPGQPASVLTQWIADTTNAVTRREFAYWVGQTLVARGDARTAQEILGKVLTEPGAAESHEQLWRVAALAGVVERTLVPSARDSASIQIAFRELQALKTAWASHAAAYLVRPDLAVLQKKLQ